MTNFSGVCQINGGCMGCCGHDFIKDKIEDAVRKNTLEFHKLNPKTKEELIAFRDRYDKNMLRSGVCRNLVEKDGCFICPLHPAENKEDLRENHCDVNYLCKTAKEFNAWDKDRQKQFIKFVKSKKLNHIKFSINMDNSTLLKRFEKNL